MSFAAVQADYMAAEKRTYGPAKVDVKALEVAKKAAALKGLTLADYISDVIAEGAQRDLVSEATKIIQFPAKPKRN